MTDIDRNETDSFKAIKEALQQDEDLKSWFCECWPCLKKLLQLIAARVPKLKPILDLIITNGDKIHGTICPVAPPLG